MTVAYGNIPPFYPIGPLPTNAVTTTFTGGPWTWTRTAVDSSAETLSTWSITGATGSLELKNFSGANSTFIPMFVGSSITTEVALALRGSIVTDSGVDPAVILDARTGTATTVTTRPLFSFRNNNASRADIAPDGGWTYTILAGGSETLATWKVSDDTSSYFKIQNISGTATIFGTRLYSYSVSTTIPSIQHRCDIETDTGTVAAVQTNVVSNSTGTITTRPLWDLQNNGSLKFSIIPLNSGANAAVTWGTQSAAPPAFTTRSAGTRLVLYDNLNASNVDFALGIDSGTLWYSVPQAAAGSAHKFYGGTTLVASLLGTGLLKVIPAASNGAVVDGLRVYQTGSGTGTGAGIELGYGDSANSTAQISGLYDGTGNAIVFSPNATTSSGHAEKMRLSGDGKLTTTGGQVQKVRVALTTPVTVVAATDHHVITNLTTPGAVAVTLPAGVAGQIFTVKDGKGDANVNNITVTPTAGNIDGAATNVINAAYGAKTYIYNGTEWNVI